MAALAAKKNATQAAKIAQLSRSLGSVYRHGQHHSSLCRRRSALGVLPFRSAYASQALISQEFSGQDGEL